MDKFLTPVSRPSSAMSTQSQSASEDERPVDPDNPIIQLDDDDNDDAGKEDINIPHVYEYIKAFWGPSKKPMTFKCRAKYCNASIKYSNKTFYNLKRHYELFHKDEHSAFIAALSAGYSYKKRSRNSSGARYVVFFLVPTYSYNHTYLVPTQVFLKYCTYYVKQNLQK